MKLKLTILLILLAISFTNTYALDGWFKGDRAKAKTNKHLRKIQRKRKPHCFKRTTNYSTATHSPYYWMGI